MPEKQKTKERVKLRYKYSKVLKANQASTHNKDKTTRPTVLVPHCHLLGTVTQRVSLSPSTSLAAWSTHHKTDRTCTTNNHILILHMANNRVQSTSNRANHITRNIISLL